MVSNHKEIKMEVWFKEFISHGRQILVKKDQDHEESKLSVHFCWPEEKFQVEFGPSFKFDDDCEESFNKAKLLRDKYFEAIDQEATDKAVESIMPEIQQVIE